MPSKSGDQKKKYTLPINIKKSKINPYEHISTKKHKLMGAQFRSFFPKNMTETNKHANPNVRVKK